MTRPRCTPTLGACLDSIKREPFLGVGPSHWHEVAPTYGLPSMEAHSLWLQATAEVGVPAAGFLMLFYVSCIARLWPLARASHPVPDPWLHELARMVIAALTGFSVSAMFVSLQGLEVPYYVTLLGTGGAQTVLHPGTSCKPATYGGVTATAFPSGRACRGRGAGRLRYGNASLCRNECWGDLGVSSTRE